MTVRLVLEGVVNWVKTTTILEFRSKFIDQSSGGIYFQATYDPDFDPCLRDLHQVSFEKYTSICNKIKSGNNEIKISVKGVNGCLYFALVWRW